MAAASCFSHIGTAHDCSERRDTSKNVLVPKSAKQMVVDLGWGARWRDVVPQASLRPLEAARFRRPGPLGGRVAREGEVLLRHSRICLCSVYGPSVIH